MINHFFLATEVWINPHKKNIRIEAQCHGLLSHISTHRKNIQIILRFFSVFCIILILMDIVYKKIINFSIIIIIVKLMNFYINAITFAAMIRATTTGVQKIAKITGPCSERVLYQDSPIVAPQSDAKNIHTRPANSLNIVVFLTNY